MVSMNQGPRHDRPDPAGRAGSHALDRLVSSTDWVNFHPTTEGSGFTTLSLRRSSDGGDILAIAFVAASKGACERLLSFKLERRGSIWRVSDDSWLTEDYRKNVARFLSNAESCWRCQESRPLVSQVAVAKARTLAGLYPQDPHPVELPESCDVFHMVLRGFTEKESVPSGAVLLVGWQAVGATTPREIEIFSLSTDRTVHRKEGGQWHLDTRAATIECLSQLLMKYGDKE